MAHYDGTTTTPYLDGTAIIDIAIAPDGSVWLYGEVDALEGTPVAVPNPKGHLYVITPGAVQ